MDDMYRLDGLDFRPRDGVSAIDAGTVVPNVGEPYQGKAPDLGPIEHGDPCPTTDRESRNTEEDQTTVWTTRKEPVTAVYNRRRASFRIGRPLCS
jgi:hypothetical protein